MIKVIIQTDYHDFEATPLDLATMGSPTPNSEYVADGVADVVMAYDAISDGFCQLVIDSISRKMRRKSA